MYYGGLPEDQSTSTNCSVTINIDIAVQTSHLTHPTGNTKEIQPNYSLHSKRNYAHETAAALIDEPVSPVLPLQS